MKNYYSIGKTVLFLLLYLGYFVPMYAQEWTWMKGSNTINSLGVYGTQGTAAPSNIAGSREGAATCGDLSGIKWMFGGNGFNSAGYGRLNDLWKWDPSTNLWTWVKGPDAVDQWGIYGTSGTASITNMPGARAYACTWIDNSGNIWMFGGFGYDASGNLGDLNDLWKYNIASNSWTWMSGSNTINQNGAYGTLGTGSSTNTPGSRRSAASWKDYGGGDLFLFGGFGFPASGTTESGMNDLWKYNIAGNTWTWVKGSNTIDQVGTYGAQGSASSANTPGARYGCNTWRDGASNIWLFAGYGYGASNQGYLNDVWKFNTITNQWTWMKGSSQESQISIFGTQTIPASINTPGGRYYATDWNDADGNLYVLGGNGISTNSASPQYLNDFWKYNITTNNWSWIRGVSYPIIGNYGTQSVTATSNDPGSGYLRQGWKDASGNFWLFGGNAYDAFGNFSVMGDLWKMNPCLPPAPISVSTFSNQNACSGVSATLNVVSNTNTISWFSAPSGGTALSTGTTYITPVLSSGTAATTSYTYYASSTNTCGNSSVRTPIIVTSNNINPTVTTGPTQFTVAQFIGNGQTPNSSWSPWIYNFTDPLPVGAIITGVRITCDAVDQGWGGTGAGLDIRLAGTRVAIPILLHYSQNFDLGTVDPFAAYNYGGNNTLELYFVGWGGWQAFMNNATLTFSYQTKTPAAITACQNSSLTLKAFGASTYSWSGGVTDNVPFAITSTQIFTVTGANIYGCVNTATQLVNATPSPTVTITGSNVICMGSTLSQTASVSGIAQTFSWSTGASTSTLLTTPTVNTTYVAVATNTVSGCSHSVKRKIIVNALPIPSVSISNGTICSGQAVSLSASSNTSGYGLNFDGVDDYIETNANITELGMADFSIEAWIKTTGTSEGIVVCNDANNAWDPGEKAFFIDAYGVPVFVGFGNNYIVGVSSVNDGTWHHVAVVWDYTSGTSGIGKIYVDGLDNTSTSSFVATTYNMGTFKIGQGNFNGYSPEAPNTFNGSMDDIRIWNSARSASQISTNMNTCLTGTESGLVAYFKFEDGPGSADLANYTVENYNGLLTNMNIASAWIQGKPNCSNSISNYLWMPGSLSTQSVSVSPTSTTNYTVTLTNNNSCQGSSTKTIQVNPSPTVTLNSGAICIGNTFTLTPGGAFVYNISGGTAVVSPTSNTNYSVTGTSSNGCVSTNTAVSTLTVNALPVLSINGPTAVCNGSSISQTVTGANTYTWSNSTIGSIIAISPTINTVYSVIGTNTVTGCLNSISENILVGTTPVITVNSGNICEGKSFTLSPNGASTYTFANASGLVSSIVSPTANTSYFVSGTSALGCVSTVSAISNVVVNAAPVISVNSGGICAGTTFTMFPSGANTYTFSNGSATVVPSANTNYSVTGTTILGCVSLLPGVASITVNAIPLISASSGTVCSGKIFTINATGAQTYSYASSSGPTSSLVTTTSLTTFSVTGTSSAGCIASNTAIVNVTAVALPIITVNSSTVCSGTIFTMVPGGAATYTFSNGSSTVMPFSNATYSVSGTNAVGCVASNTAIATVTLINSPLISVNSGSICSGKTFTIQPSGASAYTISGNSSTVSPSSSSIYTVVGISSQGCLSSNVAVSNVYVNPLPVLSISGSSALCIGNSNNLVVIGAATFTWNTGATGPILISNPVTSTNYSVNGTNSFGCINSATFMVTVNALPTITVNSGTVCPSSSFVLNPSGAFTYTFSSGSNTVFPSVTSVYSISGTDSNGCSSLSAAISTVTVIDNIALAVSGTTLVCSGEPASLNVSGALSYTWSNGTNGSSISPSPNTSTVYTVIGSDGACFDSASVFVQVNNLPVIQMNASSNIICTGETVTLTASGANSYVWNTTDNGSKLIITPTITSNYSVVGSDMNGCKNSAALTLTVNECVGLNTQNPEFSENIRVYPNPNNGTFKISCNEKSILIIRNPIGQTLIIKEIQQGETEIEMVHLANGIYSAEIRLNGYSKNYKIIKE